MNSSTGKPGPEIYLARHGACDGADAVLGSTDPPLTDEGRRQAAELARAVARLGVGDAVGPHRPGGDGGRKLVPGE